MSVEPKDGFLVLTALNREDGTADSETYIVDGAGTEYDARGGMIETFKVRDGDGDPEPWLIQIRREDTELPEVRGYRNLIRGLIAADVPCPSPGCRVTTLGHLIASLTADQVELVRELDPDQP